ncbi:NmrA/HSCARG family protein [Dyadobacter sp. UP-52]|uniref:NmrA/HSCARG family protein n=1 Tax=Dyadobacter subterraneus TaxID=2773304 RepID=A0ABR9WE52_9BACT|nr:NmrA/HSCARG family protein [Dyadobacter subterraneus]
MAQKDKPLITIVGVLGKQGLSVAHSLLESGLYRVRGITRRIDSSQATELARLGVELVSIPLDLGYKKDFVRAFSGSYGAFLMTPGIAPPMTHEQALGIELADAALEAGVQHVVFSSLEHVDKITAGKKFAPHFTDKARVEEYIRGLPMTSSFIYMAFFFTNFAEFYTPDLRGDTLEFPIYLPEDFKAPFVDPVTATGPAVLEILSDPAQYSGKSMPVIGDIISPREMVEVFMRVTKRKAVYSSAFERKNFLRHFPDYAANKALVDEILGMAAYAVEYGYFRNDRDLMWSRRINPGTLSWEQFLRSTGWQGQRQVL